MVALRCCLLLLLCLSAALTQAQPLRIGLGLQGVAYLGDLTEPGTLPKRVNTGFGLSLEKVLPRPIGFSFHAGAGSFTEQWDEPGNAPGTRFVQTTFGWGEFRAHYRPWPEASLQPFVSAGAGLLAFQPKNIDGFVYNDTAFNGLVPQLPMVIGGRFQVTPLIGLELSYIWRFTPTDFLDNIGPGGPRSGFDALHTLSLAVQVNLAPPEEVAEHVPAPLPAEPAQPISSEEATIQGDETLYNRPAALQSMEEGIFLYYEAKAGDTFEGLAKRFRVPPDLLRELNYFPGEQLTKGAYLRIPHVPAP